MENGDKPFSLSFEYIQSVKRWFPSTQQIKYIKFTYLAKLIGFALQKKMIRKPAARTTLTLGYTLVWKNCTYHRFVHLYVILAFFRELTQKSGIWQEHMITKKLGKVSNKFLIEQSGTFYDDVVTQSNWLGTHKCMYASLCAHFIQSVKVSYINLN